jgi:hypothetical protein
VPVSYRSGCIMRATFLRDHGLAMTHPNIHALSDKQVEVLGRALDIAWHRVLQTNILDAHNMAEAQQILAQRIFNSTVEGECDPWKLAREALFHLWEVKLTGRPLLKVVRHRNKRVAARTRL